ncbi:MAG: hypothetical protein ACRDE8_18350 [Ginsengibacter sp.]
MKKFIIIAVISFLIASNAYSQGCIVVRNISGFGQYNLTSNAFTTSAWQLNVNNRYFKAYHDFKGKVNLRTPSSNQNIIKSFSTDIGITRLLNKGWSLILNVPISANSRSSTLEHGGPNTPRHTTSAFGIGDVTFTAYKWLISPSVNQKGNIQIGLGIKLPTGDYKYQGYFYRNDTTRVLSAINPAIQLGDGGTGITTEVNTFYFFNSKKTMGLYGNFYYLINPRDINGTQYTMGKPLDPFMLQIGAYENSVPDVFSFRVGANVNLSQLAFSLGLRDEGSPVRDLIGQNDGSRRAGYTVSIEPGIIYKFKRATIYTYIPVTVSHSIKQNLIDKKVSAHTGVYTIGPGGSGDYQVFIGAQFQL